MGKAASLLLPRIVRDMRTADRPVFPFPMFQHRGGVRSIKIQGVPGVDVIPMGGATSNPQAGGIFKIRNGKGHEIEAMGVSLPYGTKSPWE